MDNDPIPPGADPVWQPGELLTRFKAWHNGSSDDLTWLEEYLALHLLQRPSR